MGIFEIKSIFQMTEFFTFWQVLSSETKRFSGKAENVVEMSTHDDSDTEMLLSL